MRKRIVPFVLVRDDYGNRVSRSLQAVQKTSEMGVRARRQYQSSSTYPKKTISKGNVTGVGELHERIRSTLKGEAFHCNVPGDFLIEGASRAKHEGVASIHYTLIRQCAIWSTFF
eukprot:scaffold3043_cov180-Amphora_coffeaeformis.AAC.26